MSTDSVDGVQTDVNCSEGKQVKGVKVSCRSWLAAVSTSPSGMPVVACVDEVTDAQHKTVFENTDIGNSTTTRKITRSTKYSAQALFILQSTIECICPRSNLSNNSRPMRITGISTHMQSAKEFACTTKTAHANSKAVESLIKIKINVH